MLSIKYIPYVRKSSPSRSSEMGKMYFMGYGRSAWGKRFSLALRYE